MKKTLTIRIWLIIITVLLSLIIFTTSILLITMDAGINDISAQKSIDGLSLSIKYVDCKGYAIKQVCEDEIIYLGEQPKQLGDLFDGFGKYFIKITLGDVKMSDDLQSKYQGYIPFTLDSTEDDYRFLWSHKDDSGVYLFIASNNSINIEEKEFSDLPLPFGTIKINVELANLE